MEGAKMGANRRAQRHTREKRGQPFSLCILAVTPKFLTLSTPVLSTKIIYTQLQSDPAPSSSGPHRLLKFNAARLSMSL